MLKHEFGDATAPSANTVLAHICNDKGGWGAGFVLAINRRLGFKPMNLYKKTYKYGRGTNSTCKLDYNGMPEEFYVCNMVAQEGYPTRDKPCAVDYEALERCLRMLHTFAVSRRLKIQMPRIGSGLGGGDWTLIEQIINRACIVTTTIFTLP